MGDPCENVPAAPSGTVEVGLGTDFTSVAQGEDVQMQLGPQGLWMFIVNARTQNLDVGTGNQQGMVDVQALAQDGTELDISPAIRARDFTAVGTNCKELAEIYTLPLDPTIDSDPDGQMISIQFAVSDHDGHMATDERTVVAHLPQ
jgi:hypothetical protein